MPALSVHDDRGTVDCECFVVVVGFYASRPEWPQGHKLSCLSLVNSGKAVFTDNQFPFIVFLSRSHGLKFSFTQVIILTIKSSHTIINNVNNTLISGVHLIC